MADEKIYVNVQYDDAYVQPLLVSALKKNLPAELLMFIHDVAELPSRTSRFVQWRQYESIDFDRLLEDPTTSIANSYVIRKALIRKHYLSTTISHWLTKHPNAELRRHVKPAVEFEVDYSEFLDDALVEAFELKASWERNAENAGSEKEWWILKPGMSERGQGIRLFSSEEQLTAIFEEWDPESDDEASSEPLDPVEDQGAIVNESPGTIANGIVTSQLRHFIAQEYVHPPLLFAQPYHSAERKFHIRTYVLAVGSLRVYVYKPMLALFAAQPYIASTDSESSVTDLARHLTNTCLQSGEREGSVESFWSLPSISLGGKDGVSSGWKEDVFAQICSITGEVFEAAARTMGIHFQPLPNAFEIFGLDFLVDAQGTTWLLEVNSFPDFAQTGPDLQDLIGGLFETVVEKAIKPFFMKPDDEPSLGEAQREGTLIPVLNIDLGRR